MFTTTMLVEIICGLFALAAAIFLILQGRKATAVTAVVQAEGERAGAYILAFELNGRGYNANYRSSQQLTVGDTVQILVSKDRILKPGWKVTAGLCVGLFVLDFGMLILGLLS